MDKTRELSLVLELKDRASKDLKGFRNQLLKAEDQIRSIRNTAAIAFAAVGTSLGFAVESARRAEDIESLFSLAFDDTEERAREFVSEFAEQFGRAESTVKDSVARVAFNLQKVGGISEEEMFKMSTGIQEAAEGLSLLDTNIDTAADVSQAFADSLSGSNQQLSRMIGGLIEEDIERRAVTAGIIEEGEEMDRTQRARALYLEFMESTPAAQEKMQESNRGLTDAYIQFRASVTKVSEALGNEFIPMVTDVVNEITPMINKVSDWIVENKELTRNIVMVSLAVLGIIVVFGSMALAILSVTAVIKTLMIPTIVRFAGIALAKIALVTLGWQVHTAKVAAQIAIQKLKAIPSLIASYAKLAAKVVAKTAIIIGRWVLLAAQSLFQAGRIAMAWIIAMGPIGWVIVAVVALTALIIANWDKIKKFTIKIWGQVADWLKNTWGGIKNFFSDLWDSILEQIKSWASKAIDFIKPVIDMIRSVTSSIKNIGSKIGDKISDITPFADGGIVKQPTMGLVGEAGPEAIIPLDRLNQMGGGGVTVNVYGDVSGEELVDKVQDQIMSTLRGNTKLAL